MQAQEASGRIRITKVPGGEAPEEIKKAWLGLVLPCYPIAGEIAGKRLGVVTGKVRSEEKACGDSYSYFIVPQAEALMELRKHAPAAAQWWKAHGYPHPVLKNFTFRADEAEIVSGVTMQAIREVTDEMMGDPNR
jgi:hypothetical protein